MDYKKSVYVGLSECGEVVKVGTSSDVKTRFTSLRTTNGEKFKMLFKSEEIDEVLAKAIERETTSKFKDFVIQGNEWYGNIKPIIIIEFLINEKGLKPYQIKRVETEFPSWQEDLSKYRLYSVGSKYPLIREKVNKGFYSVQFLSGDYIECRSFCNYGDAKKFYFDNKHSIEIAETIIQDLYQIEPSDLYLLKISNNKDIYNLGRKVMEAQEGLKRLLDVTLNIY